MRKLVPLIPVVPLLTAANAVLACEHPAVPSIPNGELSGRVERHVKENVLAYFNDMTIYVACLQTAHGIAASEEKPPLHLSLLATRNNVAVAELEAVRDIYEDKVGPLAELMFELPDESRRSMPRFVTYPTGPDTVLKRAEIIRGGLECPPNDAVCSKEFATPGID